jgi:hypothetical protein
MYSSEITSPENTAVERLTEIFIDADEGTFICDIKQREQSDEYCTNDVHSHHPLIYLEEI